LSNAENVTDRSVRPYGSESRGIDIVPASRSFELAFNDRDVIGMKPGKPIVFAELLWRAYVETQHLAASRAKQEFLRFEIQIPVTCDYLNSHLAPLGQW
jgi:hypothetical protein